MKENPDAASSAAVALIAAALQGGAITLKGFPGASPTAIESATETDALYLSTLVRKLTTALQRPE